MTPMNPNASPTITAIICRNQCTHTGKSSKVSCVRQRACSVVQNSRGNGVASVGRGHGRDDTLFTWRTPNSVFGTLFAVARDALNIGGRSNVISASNIIAVNPYRLSSALYEGWTFISQGRIPASDMHVGRPHLRIGLTPVKR